MSALTASRLASAAGRARQVLQVVGRTAGPAGVLAVPLAWQWHTPLGDVGDAVVAIIVEKLWLAFLVTTSFFWLRRARWDDLLARLTRACDRHAPVVLAALLAGLYLVAWLATPPIAFGDGAVGTGYGDDGKFYGDMVDRFAWSGRRILAPYCFRPLVPIVVHLLGLGTFAGFKLVNAVGFAGAGLCVYGICRRAGGTRPTALFAVALFGTLKFALKFWIYYPILTDGMGMLFQTAALWASLAGRHVLFAAVLGVGIFCRENLILLVGFHLLRVLRTEPVAGRLRALAVQAVPLALFVFSRLKPMFPSAFPYSPLVPIQRNLASLRIFPHRRAAVLLAFPNALGVLLALPVLRWRALVATLAELEWAYYGLATLALSIAAGADVDRFALWQAPLLVAALARIRPAPTPWLAVHLLALHVVAMEFPFSWDPGRDFYLSRYATHAQAPVFPYLTVDCIVVAVLAAAMVFGDREPAPA